MEAGVGCRMGERAFRGYRWVFVLDEGDSAPRRSGCPVDTSEEGVSRESTWEAASRVQKMGVPDVLVRERSA